MLLTIVGCSGSVSGPDSAASSYLVQAPHHGRTFSLLLDLGPGAFGALYRYGQPSEIDAVALSHLHPDHCLDLCAYYVAAKYSTTAPWPSLPVYAPAGAAARLAAAHDVAGPDGRQSESGPGIAEFFDYRVWQPEQQIGPFDVRVARVDHPVETYAVRIEQRGDGGGSMVFSGDTGPCDALVELATGVDLLLAEAAFRHQPTNPPGLHLSGRQAAEAGAAAGVGALVLTHIPPWNDREATQAEARPYSRAPVSLAEAGARWTIP